MRANHNYAMSLRHFIRWETIKAIFSAALQFHQIIRCLWSKITYQDVNKIFYSAFCKVKRTSLLVLQDQIFWRALTGKMKLKNLSWWHFVSKQKPKVIKFAKIIRKIFVTYLLENPMSSMSRKKWSKCWDVVATVFSQFLTDDDENVFRENQK